MEGHVKRKLLLVTGSRTLAESAARQEWARQVLAAHLEGLGADDWVLHGGATGPDQFVEDLARCKGIKTMSYRLDGYRYHGEERLGKWAPDSGATSAGSWPLVRNATMASQAKHAADLGWDVRCVALLDPASVTRGTQHTATKCADSGLQVSQHQYPASMVLVDCETTGLDPSDVMIELAMIVMDPTCTRETERWETKIALPAGVTVPQDVRAINGYDEKLWTEAMPEWLAMHEFVSRLPERYTIVAHNAWFDVGHLERAAKRCGLPWTCDASLCTRKLAQARLSGVVPSFSLGPLCDHFGISNAGAHRAMRDVERMLEVFRCLERSKTRTTNDARA